MTKFVSINADGDGYFGYKPKPRYGHTMVSNGIDTSYIFGGINGGLDDGEYFNDLWSLQCM